MVESSLGVEVLNELFLRSFLVTRFCSVLALNEFAREERTDE